MTTLQIIVLTVGAFVLGYGIGYNRGWVNCFRWFIDLKNAPEGSKPLAYQYYERGGD